ncbi:hypothetical protein Dimus_008115 [Dionaea muscipula]
MNRSSSFDHGGCAWVVNGDDRGKIEKGEEGIDILRVYTDEHILRMEKIILHHLEWELTVPTCYIFLVRFIKASIPDNEMEKNLVVVVSEEEISSTKWAFSGRASGCPHEASTGHIRGGSLWLPRSSTGRQAIASRAMGELLTGKPAAPHLRCPRGSASDRVWLMAEGDASVSRTRGLRCSLPWKPKLLLPATMVSMRMKMTSNVKEPLPVRARCSPMNPVGRMHGHWPIAWSLAACMATGRMHGSWPHAWQLAVRGSPGHMRGWLVAPLLGHVKLD